MAVGNSHVIFVLVTVTLTRTWTSTHAFDLNSAIAQLANMGVGKLPISLAELKELASPAVLQKLIQGSKGVLPTLPSLAELNRGDPTQLAKILARLKPSQGRFEPHLEEILGNAFRIRPGPSSPSTNIPEEVMDSTEAADMAVSRGVYHPSPYPPLPTGYPHPSLITRHGLQRFSSKFRKRRPPNLKSTTAMTKEEEEIDRTEAPPPFDHITDPNIRNHRLFSPNNYENFTIIDQSEDLMMDESEGQSVLTSLTSGSDGGSPDPSTLTTTTPGWVGVSPQRPLVELDDHMIHLREPLRKTSGENENEQPSETSDEQGSEVHSVNTENYFRPSPADVTGPKFVEPDQDFFTSTIRHDSEEGEHGYQRRPFTMPEFPAKVRKKQDRILNQNKQNYDQEFLSNFAPPHKYFNKNQNLPPVRVLPMHTLTHLPHHPPQFGYNGHPFAHYAPYRKYFPVPAAPLNPNAIINNKFSFLGSDEEQTEASDKNDSSWTSTFFLLGGLVAASAVVAFILPGFLGTAVVGKDSPDYGDDAHSESSKDFWEEVKGLYTDLTHIARGDFGHFLNKHEGQGQGQSQGQGQDQKLSSTEEMSNGSGESTERNFDKIKINNRNNDDQFVNDTTLAFPVDSGYTKLLLQNSNTNMTRSSRVHNNHTFLREWARVQLHLIDS